MSVRIEDIIKEIKDEVGLSTSEIERMVNPQFIFIEDSIRSRECKTVNLIYLGKFRATKWYRNNKDKVNKLTKEEHEAIKKIKRDKRRLEKLNIKQGETTSGT